MGYQCMLPWKSVVVSMGIFSVWSQTKHWSYGWLNVKWIYCHLYLSVATSQKNMSKVIMHQGSSHKVAGCSVLTSFVGEFLPVEHFPFSCWKPFLQSGSHSICFSLLFFYSQLKGLFRQGVQCKGNEQVKNKSYLRWMGMCMKIFLSFRQRRSNNLTSPEAKTPKLGFRTMIGSEKVWLPILIE